MTQVRQSETGAVFARFETEAEAEAFVSEAVREDAEEIVRSMFQSSGKTIRFEHGGGGSLITVHGIRSPESAAEALDTLCRELKKEGFAIIDASSDTAGNVRVACEPTRKAIAFYEIVADEEDEQ